MKVQILQSGAYLDEQLKRRLCKAGDNLETAEEYGNSLIEGGLAKALSEEAPKAQPKKKTVRSSKKNSKTSKSGSNNPFLS